MLKILAPLVLLLTLATAPTSSADTDPTPVPLRDKIVVCTTAEDGIQAPRLPCVWLAPRQGDRQGHSLVAYPDRPGVHRLGLVRWVSHERARFLYDHARNR